MLMFSKALATLAVAGATVFAGSALAATPDRDPDGIARMVVTYGDLDLGTAEGANTLRERLNAAVANIEGPVDERDLKAQAVCQRDHRKAMELANAMIADYRTKVAMTGPRRLHLG